MAAQITPLIDYTQEILEIEMILLRAPEYMKYVRDNYIGIALQDRIAIFEYEIAKKKKRLTELRRVVK